MASKDCQSPISLAIDHPYTCMKKASLKHHLQSQVYKSTLAVFTMTFRENIFTELVKWKINIPYGPLSWNPLTQYNLSFQNNSRLQRRGKQREVHWLRCVNSFSTSYRYFSILHENLHTKPRTGEGISGPGWALLQAINTCMALLGNEPGHVSFWAQIGNCVPSVRSTRACELVAKCFELPHAERCNRNLKQRRKNLFDYSSMELPATCSLFKLTCLLLDQMLSNTGKRTGSKQLIGAGREGVTETSCLLPWKIHNTAAQRMLCSPTHHHFTYPASEPADQMVLLYLTSLLRSTTGFGLKCSVNTPVFMMALGQMLHSLETEPTKAGLVRLPDPTQWEADDI